MTDRVLTNVLCSGRTHYRSTGSLLGSIGEVPFYMHKNQFEYWKHTQLIIDVVEGRGGMFSLESVEGKRFLTRSRAFTAEENFKIPKVSKKKTF